MSNDLATIELNGKEFTLSYSLFNGKDWPIVFIPGLGASKEVYEKAAHYLQASGLMNKLLFLDSPGFGESIAPNDFDYALDAQAELIAKLLKELDLGRCHIVGHSQGGVIGILLAEKFPKVVYSLVDLEGNLYKADGLTSTRVAAAKNYEKEIKAVVEEYSRNQSPGRRAYAQMIGNADPESYYKSAVALKEASAGNDLLKRLDAIKKTLVGRVSYFVGEKTPVPAYNKIWDSEIDVVKIWGGGHFMMIDNPKEFYRKLGQKIKSFEVEVKRN